MLLPSPIVYARTLTIPAGETVELFKVEPLPVTVEGEVMLMRATLVSLSTSRDANLQLQRYKDRDPEEGVIATMGLPGLDFDVRVEQVAHCYHSLSIRCENLDGVATHDLSYRFMMENDRDDERLVTQHMFVANPTLVAYEREHLLAEFRVSHGRVVRVNHMAFAQALNIEVFFRLNDVIISPTAGFNCGSSRDIVYPVPLEYILKEGDKLEIFANNIGAAGVVFPHRILAVEKEVG